MGPSTPSTWGRSGRVTLSILPQLSEIPLETLSRTPPALPSTSSSSSPPSSLSFSALSLPDTEVRCSLMLSERVVTQEQNAQLSPLRCLTTEPTTTNYSTSNLHTLF